MPQTFRVDSELPAYSEIDELVNIQPPHGVAHA